MSVGECWRTEAGRELAKSVLSGAADGIPVVLRARRRGIIDCLRGAADRIPCEIATIPAGMTPLEGLASVAGAGDRIAGTGPLLSLISSSALRYSVVVVDTSGEDATSWLAFAGVFATARKRFDGSAAGLVILVKERCPIPTGCVFKDDGDLVDFVDSLAAVRAWTKWRSDLVSQTAAAVAVEVCRGDLAWIIHREPKLVVAIVV